MDEHTGVEAQRSAEPSQQGRAETHRSRRDAGAGLPPGEAGQQALSGGGSAVVGARQRGTQVQSGQARGDAQTNVGTDRQALRGLGIPTLRSDAGRRTLGGGSRHQGGARDAARLDALRRLMEPPAQTQTAPQPARTQGALRRAVATRRQPPSVARRSSRKRLLDEPGRRCNS